MNFKKFFGWDLNPKKAIDTVQYLIDRKKNNPNFFDPQGIYIFSGKQGSGKTLSAVKYVKKLKRAYPNSILVSNIDLLGVNYVDYKGIKSLTDINNGDRGVIYLIDEIHLEWNSLESKSIPIEVFTEISQQRKQRKHIIGTSQLFTRVAKPFREQVDKVILCKNYLSIFQYNVVTDGDSITTNMKGELVFKPLKREIFIHSLEDYNSFDTYSKVKRLKEYNFNPTNLALETHISFFDERKKK